VGVKSGGRVGLTTFLPSVSRMSENEGATTSRNRKDLHGLYRDNFTFTFYEGHVKIVFSLLMNHWNYVNTFYVEVYKIL
jgi:hypothetical protein